MAVNFLFSKNYKNLKYRMAVGFSLAFFLVTAFITITIMVQTNSILTDKVRELSSDLTKQVTVALDSVIESYETRLNVLFLPVDTVALQQSIPPGGKVDETVVFKSRLSAIQNSGNFAVVYADGRIDGKISEASVASLGKPLYSVLSMTLEHQYGHRKWVTGDDLSSGNVFFVRRVDEETIVLASISLEEISRSITNSNISNGLNIRVVTPGGIVLYSSLSGEIGKNIDISEVSVLNSMVDKALIENGQLCVVKKCSNYWLVTATAETKTILSERNVLIQKVVILFFIALSFIIVFSIVFSMNLTMPIDTLVRRLYNQSIRDQDTKLFLKEHFKECVKETIAQAETEKYTLIQLDIDNFKQLHDLRGNTFSTRIIKELADAMLACFPEDAIMGRISHDRFMVFARLPGDSFQMVHEWCLSVQDSFRFRVEKTENATGVSVSCGVVLVPEHGTDFDLLSELTDRAVFAIKKQGKNGYHIYTPDDDVDMWR